MEVARHHVVAQGPRPLPNLHTWSFASVGHAQMLSSTQCRRVLYHWQSTQPLQRDVSFQ